MFYCQESSILQAAHRGQVAADGEIHDQAVRALQGAGRAVGTAGHRTAMPLEHVPHPRQKREGRSKCTQGIVIL